MKYRLFLFMLVSAAAALQGCAGITQEARVEPQRAAVEISPRVLETSINHIAALIEEGLLDQQQENRARELIASLKAFKHIPDNGGHALSARLEKVLESASSMVHSRLSRAEDPESQDTASGVEWVKLHATSLSAYRSGDHRKVIDTAARIRETYGPDGLGPETTAVLALSLEAEGRTEEALKAGIEASHKLDGLPDKMLLTAALARWYAERGNRREAEKWYEKLESLLSERSLMLAGLEKQLEPPHGTGDEDFNIWAKSLRSGRPDLDGILDSIELAADMVEEERFSDARAMLSRTRQWIEPIGGETALIDEAMRRMETAEELYLQRRIKTLSRSDLDLGPITNLLARERYKEALARLETVERIAGPSAEVEEIREAAVERLITSETTKAAETFLAAGKTDDLKRKKALLEETRSILVGLLSAYPGAASAGGVASYLERVDQELDKLGSAGKGRM